jgi:hypothetical protein
MMIRDNIKEIFLGTESAARGPIEKLIPNSDENHIRIHSNISTQYIVQFSIKSFVKENNQIQQKMFKKIKRNILDYTIHQIDLINHPAKILAKTAAELVMSQSVENVYSRILLFDQFTVFQETDVSKLMAFYPKMSAWLDKSIVNCKLNIKNSKFPMNDRQLGLFSINANNASKSDVKSTLRNTIIKK